MELPDMRSEKFPGRAGFTVTALHQEAAEGGGQTELAGEALSRPFVEVRRKDPAALGEGRGCGGGHEGSYPAKRAAGKAARTSAVPARDWSGVRGRGMVYP